ncbi:phosphoenolpyruvate hydrolase family protein [Aliifodinibius sp. S!AR15-10]|uniref:phosphoenolpyruvate hydrolase family protein n=1 Tax=Aliifodinibius sp. S!AR15-10 TaxID=2950437 RepID=UPI0028705BD6|nr:phosphoenolpyruvate hydrolase family protein [Aliifodinibius sp. S!AR15-10]
MPFIPYEECLNRLHSQVEQNKPIIGAGAGTGISAKFAEKGGVDIIIIYNSGRYRMAGRGSAAGILAYGDANEIVVDMAGEVLPVVEDTPVLAGVNGTDPFRMMPVFLKELKEMGFDGIQNFPTVGVIDGNFRQILEETGMSFDLEIEMVRTAHEMEMLTCPYVFDVEQAVKMTEAGADMIVTHMNTTVKGSIGVSSDVAPSLEESAKRIQEMHDAAKEVRDDVIVLCHGGPIAEPEDAQYIFDHTEGTAGFFGASSIERLAAEAAIEKQARTFKELSL